MPLTIKPPRPPGDQPHQSQTTIPPTTIATCPSPLQRDASAASAAAANTAVSEQEGGAAAAPPQRQPSPRRPEYSPITPKALPAILAKLGTVQPPPEDVQEAVGTSQAQAQDGGVSKADQHERQQQQADDTAPTVMAQPAVPEPSIPPTQYVPEPPSLPFSSEDSSDAIALRAAISTLQFQRKKAQDDLRALEKIKKLALQDPQHFSNELAAGRVKEERRPGSGMQALLERAGNEGPDTDTDTDDENEPNVVPGATAEASTTRPPTQQPPQPQPSTSDHEIPNSQPSLPSTSFTFSQPPPPSNQQPPRPSYPPIPAPQSVTRTPHINWAKYNLNATGLDQMHNQQQRWPSDARYGSGDRGREFMVSAPYDTFEDKLEPRGKASDGSVREGGSDGGGAAAPGAGDGSGGSGDGRKDSRAVGSGGGGLAPGNLMRTPSATGTVSEHVMETRRGSGRG
ncbi:hypothetical protein MBLNU230_g5720t1 [Neophaeotheca triangularis]